MVFPPDATLSTTPPLSVLDTPCNVFVLKQQASSRQTKKGIRKTPMGTLFVESLKRLEAEMATNTRNPLSLLQLSMRFLSFFLSSIVRSLQSMQCCSGWWFVWNNRKVNCRSPWGRNWQMRWSTMLIQHPSQWIHMGPTFKLYLPLTLRQKLANEVTNSLPK